MHGGLCLGIDPHASLLPAWGLTDDAAGVREFGLRAVEAAAGTIGLVKPNVAFFERHGAAGYAALETVIAAARDLGLLVIADAKRGDMGTTFDHYAEAWLAPGSPLEVDAMTAVAFPGDRRAPARVRPVRGGRQGRLRALRDVESGGRLGPARADAVGEDRFGRDTGGHAVPERGRDRRSRPLRAS